MNLYDEKVVKCSKCGKPIEVEIDVKIVCVVCDKCKKKNEQKTLSYDFFNKKMRPLVIS